MNPSSQPPEKNRKQYTFNLTLAAVAGQVGCLTLIVILAALFIGLWLDQVFSTKPFLTVALMILSVPVTLVVMFWVVRKATSRIQFDSKQDSQDRPE
jgi:F0F1-type ATP synthase assembly protein I